MFCDNLYFVILPSGAVGWSGVSLWHFQVMLIFFILYSQIGIGKRSKHIFGLVMRESDSVAFKQKRHRTACISASDQRLCFSLSVMYNNYTYYMQTFNTLASTNSQKG